MRRMLAVMMVVGLVGCKSDAKRLEDLELRDARASLSLLMYEQKRDSVMAAYPDRSTDAAAAALAPVLDSVTKYRREAALADRDLRRFLGR